MLSGSAFGSLEPQRGIRKGTIHFHHLLRSLLEYPPGPPILRANSWNQSSENRHFDLSSSLRGWYVTPRRATSEEATKLKFAISLYKRVSGQLVNYDKSRIVFNPNTDDMDILQILGMNRVVSHGMYLGSLWSLVGRRLRFSPTLLTKSGSKVVNSSLMVVERF